MSAIVWNIFSKFGITLNSTKYIAKQIMYYKFTFTYKLEDAEDIFCGISVVLMEKMYDLNGFDKF